VERRRNAKLTKWLTVLDDAKWVSCPGETTTWEKTKPPCTWVQEVPLGVNGLRVISVDSDECCDYEQAMRQMAIDRTRQALQKL